MTDVGATRSSASSTRPGASKAGLESLELKEWKVGSGPNASAERNDAMGEGVWKGTRAGRLNKNKGELYSLIKAPIESERKNIAGVVLLCM